MLDYFELRSLIERKTQKQVLVHLMMREDGCSMVSIEIDGQTALDRVRTRLDIDDLRSIRDLFKNRGKETNLKGHGKEFYLSITF